MRVPPLSAIGSSLIALATFLTPLAACAGTILSIDLSGTTWFIDAQTGTSSAPVANPFSQTNSMARGPDGSYYTATNTQLVRLDPLTGAATGGPTLSLGAQGIAITGMTYFGPSLYAINGSAAGAPAGTDSLWTIDPLTGAGATNVQVTLSGIQALAAFGGMLYAWHPTAGLVTIDPTSGAVTDPFPLVGAANEIQTLAFDASGALYGAHSSLYRVSLSDGSLAFVGQGGYGNIRGMEFIDVAPVPEPSTWIMLMAGLGLMGRIALRRLPGTSTTTAG